MVLPQRAADAIQQTWLSCASKMSVRKTWSVFNLSGQRSLCRIVGHVDSRHTQSFRNSNPCVANENLEIKLLPNFDARDWVAEGVRCLQPHTSVGARHTE